MTAPRDHVRPAARASGLGLLALLAPAALVLAACGEEPPPAPPPTDGGAVVVENPALPPDARLEWRIGTRPELSIGVASGRTAHQLFGVRDATVLPDGRIAIANGGTGEIRVFDATGAHLTSMGGAGEGPGEFRRLEAVEAWPGDSLLAWDARQQRMSVFSADGTHGRTFRLRHFEDTYSPRFLGVTPDGRLLVRGGFPQRSDEPYQGMFRPMSRYALLDAQGNPGTDLGEHPGEEGYLTAGGGFETFSEHPHAKTTVSAVWGDEVLISPNDSFELTAFDLDGAPTRRIRLDYDLVAPTREDMEAWFEAFTADDTAEERAAFRRSFEDLPLLEAFPAFEAIEVDALGFVWVREYPRTADDPLSWIVFDPAGRAQGRIQTPPGLEVYEIGADYLLGRTRDELDIERVERWALTR
ncbi:MAG: hypothetical protein RJQ04_20645 [Longimicrobiales bacterium]